MNHFLLSDFFFKNITDMLSGDINSNLKLIPNPLTFFNWLIENKPRIITLDPIYQWDDFLALTFRYDDTKEKYRIFLQNQGVMKWIQNIKSYLANNDGHVGIFDYIASNDFNYLLFLGSKKVDRYRESAKYTSIKETFGIDDLARAKASQPIRDFFSDLHGGQLEPAKSTLIQSPLSFPPPILLTHENNILQLFIRSDIKENLIAMRHISFKYIHLPYLEMLFGNTTIPIVCFESLCDSNEFGCKDGLGKCEPSKMFAHIYKSNEKDPGMVCCKDDQAIVFRISDLVKGADKLLTCKFETREIPLQLRGYSD